MKQEQMRRVIVMLLCLCGESNSGKDSVIRRLQEKGYKRVISSTTRPKRTGETDGVDYHFKTRPDMNPLCFKSYRVASNEDWYYWFNKDDIINAIKSDEVYVCIADADGTIELEHLGALPVYISVGLEERLRRYYNRESRNKNPNYKEAMRRLIADIDDFKYIRFRCFELCDMEWTNNEGDIEDTVNGIIKLIKLVTEPKDTNICASKMLRLR